MNSSSKLTLETRSLDELYDDALAHEPKLILRAGGDKSDQIDVYLDRFKQRFPKLQVTHSVDLSFHHSARYDNACAARTQAAVPDILQCQTVHDFDHYAEQDLLEPYLPANWENVFADHKDPHGRWTGLYGVTFSNCANVDLIPEANVPRDALDYLDPALRGKVILTYPHTDDAVLYQFWNLRQKYGWGYLEELVATRPTWVRGTAMPYVAIENGWFAASFTTFWPFAVLPNSPVRFSLPREDYFLTWFQTAAIPRQARHKAAARLYLNWMLSDEFQQTWFQFPVRRDVRASAGMGSVLEHNTSPGDFHRFMLQRDRVERFRLQLLQLIGEPQGAAPLEMDYSVRP